MVPACPREGYPLYIPESLKNIPLSTQLVLFFFFFSMDIPKNIFMSVKALANREIFPGVFLGIFLEMVQTGLRGGYSWEFQGYHSFKQASTISTCIPRSIPGNIPLLARTLRVWIPLADIGIFLGIFPGISMKNGASWLERWIFLRVHWYSRKRGFHVYYLLSNFSDFTPNTWYTKYTFFSCFFFKSGRKKCVIGLEQSVPIKLCVIGVSGKSKFF